MRRKSSQELLNIIKSYFPNQYKQETHYLAELSLIHGVKMPTTGGGEFPLNNANTKQLVGISDFQGTLTPSDATGLIRAVIVRYGSYACVVEGGASRDSEAIDGTTHTTPAIVEYKETRADMPAWLLSSELVLKSRGVESFRMRIQDIVPSDKPQKVSSEWAKELERTIKVLGGQDLQLFLNTPEYAKDPTVGKDDFVQIVLFGIKFAPRKSN
jgi:hypothetical protein